MNKADLKKETIIIKAVRKDKKGFCSKEDKWFNNPTKEFNIKKGDEVEVFYTNGGFIEDVLIIKEAPSFPKKTFNKFNKFNQEDEKLKIAGLVLSCVKDLCVNGKIELKEIPNLTEEYYKLVVGLENN